MKTLQELLALNAEREVIIYSKDWCGFCRAAKQVLDQIGLDYREIDVTHDEAANQEMLARSEGRYTVPQIFINGTGIGGYTDLMRLIEQAQQQQQ